MASHIIVPETKYLLCALLDKFSLEYDSALKNIVVERVLITEDDLTGEVSWMLHLTGEDGSVAKQFLEKIAGDLARACKIKAVKYQLPDLGDADSSKKTDARQMIIMGEEREKLLKQFKRDGKALWDAVLGHLSCSNAVKDLLKTVSHEKHNEHLKIIVNSEMALDLLRRNNVAEEIEEYLYAVFASPHIVHIVLEEEDEGKQQDVIYEDMLDDEEYLRACENFQDKGKTVSTKIALMGSIIKCAEKKIKPIQEITEEDKNIVIVGTVGNVDARELKSGRFLLNFEIFDQSDGIACKKFFDKEENDLFNDVSSHLKKGMKVKVKGTAQYDRFAEGDLVLFVNHINRETVILREDKAEHKRVELHLHTKMSSMDAVSSAESFVETAHRFGHEAIAITDHAVVQAFPAASDKAVKLGIKIIYGVEGYLIDDDPKNAYHIIILAKNLDGLQNLYRLITLSHLDYFYRTPRIPRHELLKYREGLIVGSACEAGELFQCMLSGGSDEEMEAIASFYDYLEIQPLSNNAFLLRKDLLKNLDWIKPELRRDKKGLAELNKKIVELGRRMGKPVVATCDAHFLNPEDEIFRRIILSSKKLNDEEPLPLYFRNTEEMLAEFSYLDEATRFEVVVSNTKAIADQIERFKPIPDDLYPPKLDGAEEEIRDMAVARTQQLYGEKLPKVVEDRLQYELRAIIDNGFAVLYLIAQKLVKRSLERGYLVGSRGSVGSSFVATMTGITEVNPLPPHWRCAKCLQSIFVEDGSVGGGFDLPDRKCPVCDETMIKDGHDIPFAVFMGFQGDKTPDIDLNFSGNDQANAHRDAEDLLGAENVFRAGTIATVAEKTAYGFVKKYLDEQGIKARNPYINSLVAGCAGAKRTTGQHPGGVMVVPRDMDVHFFTPLQRPADAKKPENKKLKKGQGKEENTEESKKTDIITTHFDYHSISERLVKLDILGHDAPSIIRMLEDMIGSKADTIPFDDEKTMSLFSSTNAIGLTKEELGDEVATLGVPEFGTRFVRQMLQDTRPKCFSELVRISGFSHGTDVWLGNAKDLIINGIAKLSDAISTRDDIMVYLIYKGVEPQIAFKIMEGVRKGRGINAENVAVMRKQNVPEWYIESCQKIKYMFPKAHAVAYVMMAFRIAYCKIYHPLAFYASHFTTKAMLFDAEKIVYGKEHMQKEMNNLLKINVKEMSANEEKLLSIMEVAREMYLRGYSFQKVSIEQSAATEFIIASDKQLLPPLVTLTGLGEEVAHTIVRTRQKRPFTSVSDLRVRGKVNKTVIELMQKHGCLDGWDDSDQISLF